MEIAVLTFDAFNEMDSFVAVTLLNRLSTRGWRAYITAPTERVISRNGIVVDAQRPLEFTAEADAVIFGSGMRTDEVAANPALLARMTVDPNRQLLVGQCSGALVMAALGLLDGTPACTDLVTRPLLEKRGQNVLDQALLRQRQRRDGRRLSRFAIYCRLAHQPKARYGSGRDDHPLRRPGRPAGRVCRADDGDDPSLPVGDDGRRRNGAGDGQGGAERTPLEPLSLA
jgi:hypothetical protein